MGVYVIREGQVDWQPSIDVNQIVSGALLTAAVYFIFNRVRAR